jgi:hypothetical protein
LRGAVPYWIFSGVLPEVTLELRHGREAGVGSPADRAWLVTLLAKAEQMMGGHHRARQLMAVATTEWGEVDDEHERALGLGRYDEALEVHELIQLEERRTGRVGTMPTALQWLADAIDAARDAVSPEVVSRAAARAADVPVAQRASRVIELARQAGGAAAGR